MHTVDHAASAERGAERRPASPERGTKRRPIVLVPGFLGPAWHRDRPTSSRWYNYWGEARTLGTSEAPVLCAWPSGLASLHDRACELFAQIKGGVTDYGMNINPKPY